MTSITANTGATIQGQLLARNGAVTLQNNTIINGFCGLTVTASPGSVPTPTPVATSLALPTATPTATSTVTNTPSVTPTVTNTPSVTNTPAVTPTATPVQIPQTGDNGDHGTLLGILALSAGALMVLAGVLQYLRRKQKMKP